MKTFKFLLFLFTFLFSINSFCQKNWETKEQIYTNGVSLQGMIDVETSKVLGLFPMGKNVYIKYDPFFDKYDIEWLEETGTRRMELKFFEKNSGGNMYIDKYSDNTPYFVHNEIKNKNKLSLITANNFIDDNRKVKLVFIFEDLK